MLWLGGFALGHLYHDLANLQATCLGLLEEQGYAVIIERSFAPIQDELPAFGKTILTPNLDPAQNDFTSANHFCLTLRKSDELAAVVAVRLDRTGNDSIDRFWADNYTRLYPTKDGKGAVSPEPTEILRGISGDIAYIGDLFIKDKFRGYMPTLMCFVLYAHSISYAQWKPDWIYSFQRRADVLAGRTDQYSFNSRHPGILVWNDPPDYRSSTEYLATLSRREFERLASVYSEHPELLVFDPRSGSRS